MFALVRTGRFAAKQDGISFILIDLSLPGIRIRPIVNLCGDEEFCEVFFDDVRVPRSELVGELHQGWPIARSLLDFERLFNGSPRMSARTLHLLEDLGRKLDLFASRTFREEFAVLALDLADLKALYMHYEAIVRAGERLPDSVSILKLLATETYARIARRLTECAMEHGGDAAAIDASAKGLIPSGPLLHAVATRIYGGSNEIQRNVLAKRVLGLPS